MYMVCIFYKYKIKCFKLYSKFDIFVELFNDDSIKNELSVILPKFQCITDTISRV